MTAPTTAIPSAGAAADPARSDLLRRLVTGTSSVVGKSFLRALAHHLCDGFDAEVVFVAELLDDDGERARVIAVWTKGDVELAEGHDFSLHGTPCAALEAGDVVAFSDGVTRAFPADELVARHGLDAYVAVAMRGANGARIGHIGIQARRQVPLSGDDLAVLQVFAARAAAELERVRHEVALREREREAIDARSRSLRAADEERRRIGRDLHDGAQQRLVVLGQYLDLARRRLPTDRDEAIGMIEEARSQARATGEELRELTRGLYPAGLADAGLGQALSDLVRRTPLPVRIGALPDRRLPDVVEVTLFALVSEAITNAVKYADATELRVELGFRAGTLVAEVRDDGCGGAEAGSGSGLRGLADRVALLGGSLEVESPPGEGTTLRASLPARAWRTAREPFLEFGHEGDDGMGERLITQIIDGDKTATVSLAREWELEGGLPRIGQQLPVVDGNGQRRSCVEVQRVTVVPFGEVGPDIVAATEGGHEDDVTWRADQRRYYDEVRAHIAVLLDEPGWRLTDEEPMAILWFRVV